MSGNKEHIIHPDEQQRVTPPQRQEVPTHSFYGPTLEELRLKKVVKPPRKSERILQLEEECGEPLQAILKRLYNEEQYPIGVIQREIGVKTSTFYRWLDYFGIEKRSREESEALRGRAISRHWDEHYDDMVAKIHTPESDAIRAKKRKQFFQENPEEFARQIEKGQRTLESRRAKKLKEMLGDDPGQRLKELHHYQCLTVEDMASDLGITIRKVKTLLRQYSVEETPVANAQSIRNFQKVQAFLHASPEALQALNEQEKEVVYQRFLQEGAIPTIEEVAKTRGVKRQRIHQIESKAIKKLEQALKQD